MGARCRPRGPKGWFWTQLLHAKVVIFLIAYRHFAKCLVFLNPYSIYMPIKAIIGSSTKPTSHKRYTPKRGAIISDVRAIILLMNVLFSLLLR